MKDEKKILGVQRQKLEYQQLFLLGPIIIIRGENLKNNLLIKYENLVNNPKEEFFKITNFLKIWKI